MGSTGLCMQVNPPVPVSGYVPHTPVCANTCVPWLCVCTRTPTPRVCVCVCTHTRECLRLSFVCLSPFPHHFVLLRVCRAIARGPPRRCGAISSNANYSPNQKPFGARTGCLAQWRNLHGFPRGRTVLAAPSPRRPTHPALGPSARPSGGPEPGDPRPGSRHRAALRRFEPRERGGNGELRTWGGARAAPRGDAVCLRHRGASVSPCGSRCPPGVPVPPVRSRRPHIPMRMPVSPWGWRCLRGGPGAPRRAAGVCPRPAPVAMGTARPAPR